MSLWEGSSCIHLQSCPLFFVLHSLNHKCYHPLSLRTNVCSLVSFSLARATLVLIPLLGIHEVVFTVLIDECVEGSSRYARNFINLTLSSFQVTSGRLKTYLTRVILLKIHMSYNMQCVTFQGFLVAVLYCFANGEVGVFFCMYCDFQG